MNTQPKKSNGFQERTWEWATTGDHGRGCPIEGGVGNPEEAFRAAVLERLEDVEKFPDVEFVVFVQNVDLSSPRIGTYNVRLAGPGMTWTAETIEELKADPCSHFHGDLPSERLYPQWYISRQAHLETKEKSDEL